jgi:hypothetical protein
MSDTKLAEKDAHRLLRLRTPKDARAIAVMVTANHLSVYAAAERFYGTAWNWHRREEKPGQHFVQVGGTCKTRLPRTHWRTLPVSSAACLS